MAHLLIIELPAGSDSDIVQAALSRGDRYTFVSANLAAYQRLPAVQALLDRAQARIEVPGLASEALEPPLLQLHASDPFDGLLCLVLSCGPQAARLARRLHLRFLNPASAALLSEPAALQQRLQARGLAAARQAQDQARPPPPGILIGCDTRTEAGRHTLLGVHEQRPGGPASGRPHGSSFTPNRPGFETIERQVFAVLDALDFDFGAAHVELLLSPGGPRVASVGAPLAGSAATQLVGYATGRPVHQDLIALHCGQPRAAGAGATPQVAVLRWVSSGREGLLDEIVTPVWHDPAIRRVEIRSRPGDWVRPARADDDRLAWVLVCGPGRADAEALADCYVARTQVRLREPDEENVAAAGLESTGWPPDASPVQQLRQPHPPAPPNPKPSTLGHRS